MASAQRLGDTQGAQRIVFGDTYTAESDRIKLIEMSEDILAQALQHGVDIKGNDDEPVVLCTLTKTYVVRNVDTTNANLLMPSSNGSLLPNGKRVRPDSDLFDNFRPVAARTSAHYELVHIAPRTENLAAVMLARAADGGRATGGYRMPELRNLVQASEEEIVSKLVELNAYFHDGLWYLLSLEQSVEITDMILNTVDEKGWGLGAVAVKQCVDEVVKCLGEDTCSEMAVYHNVSLFVSAKDASPGSSGGDGAAAPDSGKKEAAAASASSKSKPGLDHVALKASSSAPDFTVTLCPRKIGIFRALQLFSATRQWDKAAMLEHWQSVLPVGVSPDLDWLSTIAVDDVSQSGEQWLTYFPATELSVEPQERFQQLFAFRQKWNNKDVRPYLNSLPLPAGMSIDKIVLKYCRMTSTPEGVIVSPNEVALNGDFC